jgi:hypothetical protein
MTLTDDEMRPDEDLAKFLESIARFPRPGSTKS